MSKFVRVRHSLLPIGLALITCATALISVLGNRVKESNSFTLNSWDYSTIIGGLSTLVVSIFYAIFDYFEKKAAAKLQAVRLTLRGLKSQPKTLGTWVRDEREVACILSIWVDDKTTSPARLFDVVVRYGHLTSPISPGEFVHERIVVRENWEHILQCEDIYAVVEPVDDETTPRASAIYDRETLSDYLFDDEDLCFAHPDSHQLLVVSKNIDHRIEEFKGRFRYPDEVQVVITQGAYPRNDDSLPTLFNVFSHLELDFVGKKKIFTTIDYSQVTHQFAISATFYPDEIGIRKSLLYYSAMYRIAPQ